MKNRESLSVTIESQLKKKEKRRSPKLKMLLPLYNQTVNLETDDKSCYHSFKLKVQSFYIFKAQKSVFNNMHL